MRSHTHTHQHTLLSRAVLLAATRPWKREDIDRGRRGNETVDTFLLDWGHHELMWKGMCEEEKDTQIRYTDRGTWEDQWGEKWERNESYWERLLNTETDLGIKWRKRRGGKKKETAAIWKSLPQYFNVDAEHTNKRTLPNMERQTDWGTGGQGGSQCRSAVCKIHKQLSNTELREWENSRESYLSRYGSTRLDKLRWMLPPLSLSSDRTRGTVPTPTPEKMEREREKTCDGDDKIMFVIS